MVQRIRYLIFLREVLIISVSAFGGPQAHFAVFLRRLVKHRGYLSEEELLELYALCQILPGPTSTQVITALGFKIGGPNLAYLTLLVWIMPAFIIMTSFGLLMSHFHRMDVPMDFARYITPMAVGFVAYASFVISSKVVKSYVGVSIMIVSAILTFQIGSPYLLPAILIISGGITASKYKSYQFIEKKNLKINFSNFFLWAAVLISVAVLGHFIKDRHIILFENFYRNGSLIFGGGQVLIPLLYTEFVDYKGYLSSEEFLTGYAFVQALPGPVFSFCAYLGALNMRDYGLGGEILGAFLASAGIFLPGTFFIFFTIRFWEELKKFRVVKASLEGINAASAGMVIAATFVLFEPIETNLINTLVIVVTFVLLAFSKVPAPLIILGGFVAGLIF